MSIARAATEPFQLQRSGMGEPTRKELGQTAWNPHAAPTGLGGFFGYRRAIDLPHLRCWGLGVHMGWLSTRRASRWGIDLAAAQAINITRRWRWRLSQGTSTAVCSDGLLVHPAIARD